MTAIAISKPPINNGSKRPDAASSRWTIRQRPHIRMIQPPFRLRGGINDRQSPGRRLDFPGGAYHGDRGRFVAA